MTTHAPGPMPSDLQQIPSVTDVGQHAGRGPTPGVALAAGRVPQAPTLPDFDPTSLTQALAQMANSLFQAPPPGSAMPEPVHVDTLQPSTAPSRAPAAPLHAGEQTAVPPPASAVPGAAAVPAPRTADAGIAPIVAAAPAAPQPAAPAAPVVSPAAPHVAAPASPEAPSPDQSTAAVAGSAPSPPFLGARAGEWGASPPNPWSAPLTFDDALFADQASHAPELASFRVPFVEAPAAPVAAPAPAAPAASSPRYATAIDPVVDTGIAPTRGAFDAHALRREFPILSEIVHGDKRLIWLDNAATTQKPRAVIERVKTFYERENSNIHRAAHALAARATDAYENARESTRRFLNAGSVKEIVFVRGATEGINLVAQAWGRRNVQAGDEIVLTNLEHHANIVPWQMLAQEKGARLRVAPVDDRGQIILEEYERLLSRKTRLVALPQVSNALGTVTPAQEMIEMAHRHGARVLLDGAQSVSHMRVDMQRLNPDFFVFSGHKIFGLPASARSTARRRCSTRCRRGKAAGT